MTVGETRTLSFKVHKHTWLTTVPLFLCYINPKIFSSSRLLSISLCANFQKGYSDQMHRSIIDECCKKCLIACHFHANVLMQCVNKLTWMVSLKASRRNYFWEYCKHTWVSEWVRERVREKGLSFSLKVLGFKVFLVEALLGILNSWIIMCRV